MSPKVLAQVLYNIPKQQNFSHIITGMENNEDASVVSIPEGKAIVQTVDFFTPIVNDPYYFGKIAAANALSDVYVMGGIPWCAMNLVMFPSDEKPLEILQEILRGGSDTLQEAKTPLVGGHSIDDDSIKYGLSVTGIINPLCIATNSGLQEGDILILTKALGTGILVSAIKNEVEGSEGYEKSLIESATKLNKGVSQAIQECGIKACTDITGFGLAGHALEMAKASNKHVILEGEKLPFIEGVKGLLEQGYYTGGGRASMEYAKADCIIKDTLEESYVKIAFDAQTSGGALLAVNEKNVKKVINILAQNGDMSYIVGNVKDRTEDSPYLSLI